MLNSTVVKEASWPFRGSPPTPTFLEPSDSRPPPRWLGSSDHTKKPLLHNLGWMPPYLVVTRCFHSPCLTWFKAKQQKREHCTVLNFCFKNKNQRWESTLHITQPMVWKGAWVVTAYASWSWTSRLWASCQPLPPPPTPTLSPQTGAY